MKTLFVSVSATTGSPFNKGDRVVAKFDTNEWYVGTVSANRLGRVHVQFDDGEYEDYAFGTKNVLKLTPKLKKKIKDELTEKQALKLHKEFGAEDEEPAPKAKSKVQAAKDKMKEKVKAKATTKPAAPKAPTPQTPTKKPVPVPKVDAAIKEVSTHVERAPVTPVAAQPSQEINLQKFFADNMTTANHFSEADYLNNPILGVKIRTGRQGASGNGFVIGLKQKGRWPDLVVYTAKSGTTVNTVVRPLKGFDRNTAFKESLDFVKSKAVGRVSYNEFVAARRATLANAQDREESQKKREEKSVLNDPTFSEYDLVGKTATIRFSNGHFSYPILDYSYGDKKIAIRGGGSKRRWIHLRDVVSVK